MDEQRQEIIDELTKNLYDLKRWPHYQLLFEDINQVIKKITIKDRVAILERCYIYDGYSIFSSLFDNVNLEIFDFIPPKSDVEERKNAQLDKLDFLPKTQKKVIKSQFSTNIYNLKDKLNTRENYDYIFIPNVLHHHPNPFELFKICNSSLNEKGHLYVFDATLRENHQQPDDFLRFTPDGVIYALENNGFKDIKVNTSKSPVEALIYTIDQVIQYDLPKNLLKEINNLNEIIKNKYSETLKKNYNNKIRKYTSFPVAYSVIAQKN